MSFLQNEVRWGIIGSGAVCEKKSGPAFYHVPQSRLVAVMRRNRNAAADFALRHNVPRWYSRAEELIADPEVDAVYVATPPSTHAEYAISAMRAGKPVYVEKPMAASVAECETMAEVSAQTGVPLFVAYYRRSLPYFQKVRALLAEEAIGKPLAVHVRLFRPPSPADALPALRPWRVDPSIAGAGYFYDLASHTLDILDYLLGPIVQVSGQAVNLGGLYEAEDTLSASFRFASGAVASGEWSFVAPAEEAVDTIEILGSRGVLSFSTFAFSPVECRQGASITHFPSQQPDAIQYFMIESIVNALLGKGKSYSDLQGAIRTQRVMDTILGKYPV